MTEVLGCVLEQFIWWNSYVVSEKLLLCVSLELPWIFQIMLLLKHKAISACFPLHFIWPSLGLCLGSVVRKRWNPMFVGADKPVGWAWVWENRSAGFITWTFSLCTPVLCPVFVISSLVLCGDPLGNLFWPFKYMKQKEFSLFSCISLHILLQNFCLTNTSWLSWCWQIMLED